MKPSISPSWQARPGLASAAVLLLTVAAHAQQGLPYTYRTLWPPPGLGGLFAQHMLVRDFDKDGFNDVLATSAQASGGFSFSGKVTIFYGPTLTRMLTISAEAPQGSEEMGYFNNCLAVGDANGDGEYDLLIGANWADGPDLNLWNSGRAHLFLGPDFTTDIALDDPEPEAGAWFGRAVVLADFDGDGLDDVAVGAPLKTPGKGTWVGQAWFWRAPDWSAPPVQILQPDPQGAFGHYMTSVPALGGGRGRDLLVAAPAFETAAGNHGELYRYDGQSLALNDVIEGPSDWVGWAGYASLGDQADLNGDGALDLFVHRFDAGAGGEGVSAAILAGPDYATSLVNFIEPPGNSIGFANEAAIADLDRDGHLDLLAGWGDYTFSGGAAQIYWGPDFQGTDLIGPEFFGFDINSFGAGVEVGDIDNDGFAELFIETKAFGLGILYIFHRQTLKADAEEISVGAGASVGLTIDLPADLAGHGYAAALSLQEPGEGIILAKGSYLPLLPDALTSIGLSLLGSPLLQDFAGTLDEQGDATLVLNWPAGLGSPLAGSTLHIAALTVAPNGRLGPGTIEVRIDLLP